MKAVDTNVLVRFFVDDDERQSKRARAIVVGARARGEPLFVPEIVVVELVWVLRARYKRPLAEIQGLVAAMLASPDLQFADRERLSKAHAAWCSGEGDLADYVLREQALAAGCEAVLTFDASVQGEAGFEAA